jgi:hypothetical protein
MHSLQIRKFIFARLSLNLAESTYSFPLKKRGLFNIGFCPWLASRQPLDEYLPCFANSSKYSKTALLLNLFEAIPEIVTDHFYFHDR